MPSEQLPQGWTRLKFSDMATQISERVDDPTQAGVDIYVGLEHLDPGDLRIRRHGKPSDVEATKLRVRPGQIIFGKRRAYQRKVAVSDFDGICSAHAMILQEKAGLVPGFLPFFMQSDIFMDRAVTISEGGLSPTIKWKTLAAQEFVIPPPEQQRELVELLHGMEAAIEAGHEVLQTSEALRDALRHDLFSTVKGRQTYLEDIADVKAGQALSPNRKTGTRMTPYLRVENLKNGDLNFEDVAEMNLSENEFTSLQLMPGDVVMIGDNANSSKVGLAALYQPFMPSGFAFQNHLLRIRSKSPSDLDPGYLFQIIRYMHKARAFNDMSSGTTIKHLRVSSLAKTQLIHPSLEDQRRITQVLEGAELTISNAMEYLAHLRTLRAAILNTALSPAPSQEAPAEAAPALVPA